MIVSEIDCNLGDMSSWSSKPPIAPTLPSKGSSGSVWNTTKTTSHTSASASKLTRSSSVARSQQRSTSSGLRSGTNTATKNNGTRTSRSNSGHDETVTSAWDRSAIDADKVVFGQGGDGLLMGVNNEEEDGAKRKRTGRRRMVMTHPVAADVRCCAMWRSEESGHGDRVEEEELMRVAYAASGSGVVTLLNMKSIFHGSDENGEWSGELEQSDERGQQEEQEDVVVQQVQLEGGHLHLVDALCFCGQDGKKLLSCSEDGLVAWTFEEDDAVRGQRWIEGVGGRATFIHASEGGEHVIVGLGDYMLLLNGETGVARARLEGHRGRISGGAFFYKHPFLFVSVGEDRMFRIWNCATRKLEFTSGIEGAQPFVSVAVDCQQDRFFIASADGRVRMYDLIDSQVSADASLQRSTVDYAAKLVSSIETSRAVRTAKSKLLDLSSGVCQTKPASESVFSRLSASFRKGSVAVAPPVHAAPLGEEFVVVSDGFGRSAASTVADLVQHYGALNAGSLENPLPDIDDLDIYPFSLGVMLSHLSMVGPSAQRRLLVCSPRMLLAFDLSSLELEYALPWCDLGHPSDSLLACIDMCHGWAVLFGTGGGTVNCLPLPGEDVALDANGNCLWVSMRSSGNESLSVFAREPFPGHYNPDFVKKASGQTPKGQARPRSTSVINKPVTFHSRIKSTGYGKEQPWSKSSAAKTHKTGNRSVGMFPDVSAELRRYPVGSEHVFTLDSSSSTLLQSFPVHNGPILCGKFSPDGRKFASGGSDKTVSMFRFQADGLPANDGYPASFVGHSAAVTDVNFGHSNGLFVSSAGDGTARVWKTGRKDALLVIDRTISNMKAASASADNRPLSTDVRNARFYGLDKFIVLAAGASIFVYKTHLETEPKTDLDRSLSQNKFKSIDRISTSAQSISCVACVNSFMSPLIIAGTSAKTLDFYDVCAGKWLRTVSEAHSRPLFSISLQENSMFSSRSANDYEFCLTSGLDSTVKMWDIRTGECVQRFQGSHISRTVGVNCQQSPCGRYVAVGSEDNHVHMYDVRTSKAIGRLGGATDTVPVVAFHPQHPKLLSASFDQKVRYYTASESPLQHLQ